MTPEDEDATIASMIAAVRDAMGARGVLATRVVVVTEAIDLDGRTALWVAADQDVPAWGVLGILDYAAEQLRDGARDRSEG